MSDISLLMAGVLATAPISALNLPEQPVITADNLVQQSTQENLSQVVSPAEITPPEFVQPDITTSSAIKPKYENILRKSREKIQFINSSNLPELKDTQAVIKVAQNQENTEEPQPPDSYNQMSQVTSVSQLKDVQPSDWAFDALQSLVERYGCIAGYQDGNYLGNRTISRYEFAAGLNACLEKINEAMPAAGYAYANNKVNTVNSEDLILLQRLQSEFKAELQQLQQRVETIEQHTTELQANQFSTTTRLFGQAVFSVQGSNSPDVDLFPRDGVPERQGKTNLTFTSSAQLTLATSFTGRDLLLTGLSAGNLGSNASLLSTNMGRLGFESNTDNNLVVSDLSYRFLVSDNLGIVVGTAGVNPINTFRGISPLEGSSDGAISLFGQRNPILSIGNGTGGIGFDWQISDRISLQGVYSAEIPNFSGNINQGGLFGGRFTAGAQLSLAPTNNIDIGVHYLYSHSPDGLLGSGIGDSQLISPFADATAFDTQAIGATVTWRINPNLQLGGWGGFTSSKPFNLPGSVETTNWMVFAAFPNLLHPGNLGGVLVGQPPKITSSTLPDGFNFPNFSDGGTAGGRNDTSIHVELFYRAQLSDNIALTPGLFVIFNPDHNAANDALVVGALRATFRF
ncbi:MAG: iron uptake porin [Nostoc sp. NMS1]|uniref:iron uptake porin n=1 Tax=unclassified Nostoc TaxID=2593658 RepID=UPI0025CFB6BB|nr:MULTISPECIES: iron uptake porin [unclassified Nostoc]MBN3911370.1 iron uptake porin [Nostoc sp. NMS1]MBN3995114.1 iron uptake porin [Nostoc sp. NMS2]